MLALAIIGGLTLFVGVVIWAPEFGGRKWVLRGFGIGRVGTGCLVSAEKVQYLHTPLKKRRRKNELTLFRGRNTILPPHSGAQVVMVSVWAKRSLLGEPPSAPTPTHTAVQEGEDGEGRAQGGAAEAGGAPRVAVTHPEAGAPSTTPF